MKKPSRKQNVSTTAEARGKGLDPAKLVKAPSPVIYNWPFQGGNSAVTPQCYMLSCPCVYLSSCSILKGMRHAREN